MIYNKIKLLGVASHVDKKDNVNKWRADLKGNQEKILVLREGRRCGSS